MAPAVPAVRTDALYVVHTSVRETLAALRVAQDVAGALGVPLNLVDFHTSDDAPQHIVEIEAAVDHIRDTDVVVRRRSYVCREERRAVPLAFRPQSLIVMAGRRSWWPTHAERWRRMLEAAGHFVVFVDASERNGASHG